MVTCNRLISEKRLRFVIGQEGHAVAIDEGISQSASTKWTVIDFIGRTGNGGRVVEMCEQRERTGEATRTTRERQPDYQSECTECATAHPPTHPFRKAQRSRGSGGSALSCNAQKEMQARRRAGQARLASIRTGPWSTHTHARTHGRSGKHFGPFPLFFSFFRLKIEGMRISRRRPHGAGACPCRH